MTCWIHLPCVFQATQQDSQRGGESAEGLPFLTCVGSQRQQHHRDPEHLLPTRPAPHRAVLCQRFRGAIAPLIGFPIIYILGCSLAPGEVVTVFLGAVGAHVARRPQRAAGQA